MEFLESRNSNAGARSTCLAMMLAGMFGITSSILAVTGDLQAKPTPKHGVIDMQAVILNVDEGKKARADLEKEIKAKENEFQKEKEELDKLNQEWKSQAALLSEAARLKKQQDFQERFLGLRNAELNFQSEIKRKEQKATQGIAVNVARLVDTMAKARDLEAVFETNSAGLLYLKDPVDLTKDVVAEYEKQFGGKAKVAKNEKDGKGDKEKDEGKDKK